MYKPKIKSANIEIYIWVIWYSKTKTCLHICILYSFNKVANFKKVPTLNKLPPLPSQKNWSAQDEYWLLLLYWLTIYKFTLYYGASSHFVTIHCFVAKYSNYCNNMYLLTYTCWKWWKLNKHPAPNKHPPHILSIHSWRLKLKEAPRGLIQINMVHKFVF